MCGICVIYVKCMSDMCCGWDVCLLYTWCECNVCVVSIVYVQCVVFGVCLVCLFQ